MNCPYCNESNRDTAQVCRKCGRQLPAGPTLPAQASARPMAAPPPSLPPYQTPPPASSQAGSTPATGDTPSVLPPKAPPSPQDLPSASPASQSAATKKLDWTIIAIGFVFVIVGYLAGLATAIYLLPNLK